MRGALLVLVACGGEPAGIDPDGARDLGVTLIAPNGGEQLVPAQATTIRWTATQGSVELALVDAAGRTQPIAAGLPAEVASFSWTPAGVRAPTRYKVRITLTSATGGVASDESDAELTISPPATGVSLAADLGPLFEATCTTQFCHSTATQASALDLTPARAHAQLVGVPSKHTACAAFDRVVPGSPEASFLMFKLAGSGPCFAGVRMPKGLPALSAAQLQLVRDWILEGASNN